MMILPITERFPLKSDSFFESEEIKKSNSLEAKKQLKVEVFKRFKKLKENKTYEDLA